MRQYISTRNSGPAVSAAQAITRGLAEDGGLFTPVDLPRGIRAEALAGLSYREAARRVISSVFDEFLQEEIAACVDGAYGAGFDDERIVPLTPCGAGYLMELWHGPTCAFKDLALTVLPRLLTLSRRTLGLRGVTAILTATSGDTGKAALSGFADVPDTDVTVFYPRVGVSAMQKRQMQTAPGANVEVVAVDGNFDDCQRMVKSASSAPKVLENCRGVAISSANSINIGRLVPQIVYYFTSYAQLLSRRAVKPGDKVNFVVPTGNFGDILAGYMAWRMGLPVGRLVCASNSNDVLTDFINTGVYDANRPFRATISPSMDILISSNVERLLFALTGDAGAVAGLMADLRDRGRYELPASCRDALSSRFAAFSAGEDECRAEIARMWREEGVLIDPHTAVAACAARRYRDETGDASPTVVLSTASPYKFPRTVLSCLAGEAPEDEFRCMDELSALTRTPIPAPLAAMRTLPIRFTRCIGRGEGIDYIADKMARLSGAAAQN